MTKQSKTKTLTFIGLMAAISTVIYYVFPEIPLVPGVEYLKMDFSDIPAIISGVTFGPLSGVIVEVVKNVIHLLRTTSFGIGEVINVGIGSTIIVVLCQFSKLMTSMYKKEKFSPVVYYTSSVVAIIASIIAGWILNAFLTPVYYLVMGFPITTTGVLAGVWSSTLLNTIKAALNLLPFYPMYFALNKAFSKIYH